jgi:hypothetical protein
VLHDDNNYAPPEDFLGPNNADRTVWGYPLEFADWQSFLVAHRPWRQPGETQAAYVARIAPSRPDYTPEEIALWFESASTYPP